MERWGKKRIAVLLVIMVVSVACSETSAATGDDDDQTVHDTLIIPETADTATVNKPFPQSVDFTGCIKPSTVTQSEMNETVEAYYEYWKSTYLRSSNGATKGGGCYVFMQGTGGDEEQKTTSEAHGYGMIILALMAGYDPYAKNYFDSMYNMYDKHRSILNSANMSSTISADESSRKDSDSATDGDMDIAYALILADRQWGSSGTIDYLEKAVALINDGIKAGDMGTSSYRTLLGDWVASSDGEFGEYDTRSSDWMPDHFAMYKVVTGDVFWDNATAKVFELTDAITTGYSSSTGLMPDFVTGAVPQPASADFLEADTDGFYSWNGCRVPWRMATAYAHMGLSDAKEVCVKMLTWLKTETDETPSKICAGYKLDGTPLESYSDTAFVAPFIAACVVDSSYQQYLDDGWALIANDKNSYFGDTINLLCQLLISGNWWSPDTGE